ncbi:MAG: helix-turn-helix transcriptional regulator [Lachnospiraceae bacterium]|nr:helix-turn-helix transcriptional regulator [Lachnospiraceae bacterium]
MLDRIQQLLIFNQWSLYKLAKVSDLPYSSLSNLINRRTCPTIATLEKICNGFNISLTDFFNFKENPLRNESISEEEQQLLNAYAALSQKDKDLLTAYLKGLQHSHRP